MVKILPMNDKTRVLLELGEVQYNSDWPDYLQHGFDETDVDALLALIADDSINQADTESNEVWAPLHAWRALGQIGSARAAAPLLAQFDTLVNDDWAIPELSKVMGMIGAPAIPALAKYINEPYHDEFARVMAVDGLAEIALARPECRPDVVAALQDYMACPDEPARVLNGLLIGRLIDLGARETIDAIRQLFARHCVDITCNGDLEEVEMLLGLRTERATPKPDFVALNEIEEQAARRLDEIDSGYAQISDVDELYALIDDCLMRYGEDDDAILNVSELDGFFAALGCSPDMILPSRWMPAIWGGDAQTPDWDDEQTFEAFSQGVFAMYNEVMQSLNDDDFEALFLEREVEGETYTIVDDWCDGFLRGVNLWGPLAAADAAATEDCLQSLRLFATEAGFDRLETMTEDEVVAHQQLIEPDVRRLFQHFFARRGQPGQPLVREAPKVGRNDPCPCGSGKKYKKCCLH
jgi:uncharacterized protein